MWLLVTFWTPCVAHAGGVPEPCRVVVARRLRMRYMRPCAGIMHARMHARADAAAAAAPAVSMQPCLATAPRRFCQAVVERCAPSLAYCRPLCIHHAYSATSQPVHALLTTQGLARGSFVALFSLAARGKNAGESAAHGAASAWD